MTVCTLQTTSDDETGRANRRCHNTLPKIRSFYSLFNLPNCEYPVFNNKGKCLFDGITLLLSLSLCILSNVGNWRGIQGDEKFPECRTGYTLWKLFTPRGGVGSGECGPYQSTKEGGTVWNTATVLKLGQSTFYAISSTLWMKTQSTFYATSSTFW